jgi:hypothetical protein
MADRYWVGGSASWDGTAGTKWSLTSGGAGGEPIPTTADDVFFDVLSTGTCTIAIGNTGAKSINCTGFIGTIAGSAAITVAGSVTLSALMTYTHTGTMTLTGTGTLTTAGKTFSAVTVNGSGITVTLGDALNIQNRQLSVLDGIFDTANYSVTAGTLVSQSSNTRTINLGSSTLTLALTAVVTFSATGTLTFNAGTSQINCSNASASVQGFGKTFYNVSFTSTAVGTRSITGANTFNNLTLDASATGLSQLSIAADQTVSGTFTCAGSSAIARGFVLSGTIGTSRTITCAAVSATDCDFRDITIAGAAAPISPTRGGDCGGNSGITFPAAKTVYRVGTNGGWQGSSSWALTSGGAGSNDNFPLAQDTAIINEDTALTGTLSTSVIYNHGSLDCSARTTGITLAYTATGTRYGSYTLGSGVTVSGTSAQTFSGRSTMVFTSAGKTITFPITVNTPSGTFRLGDAFSASSSITHGFGTFDAFNYNLTCTTFTSGTGLTRTINMGSGLWTLSGTGIVWEYIGSNKTLNKDTANILFSNTTTTAREFRGGSLSYNKLTIGGATGTSVTTISFSNNSFTELASTKTVAHTVRIGANQGTIGTWSITGTAGNVVTVDTASAGTRRTFGLTNVTTGIDYLSVKDIGVTQANRFYVGANSTDGGNNLNVIFTDAPGGSVNVDVTGVEAIGSVGIGTVVASARAPPTGVEALGAVGTVLTSGAAQTTLTGVEALGAVGTAAVSLPRQVLVTGVEALGAVGTVLTSSAAQTTLTGVEALGAVGTVNVTALANVIPTGVSAEAIDDGVGVSASGGISIPVFEDSVEGEIGTVSVRTGATVSLTGVEALGAVGAVVASIPTQFSVTGVEALGAVGAVVASIPTQFSVTGVEATGAVGTVLTSGAAQTTLTGVEATGSVGTVVAGSVVFVQVTGVEATGAVGTVLTSGAAQTTLTGVEATGSVGTPSFSLSGAFPVTGVEASGAVGTANATGLTNVRPIGVQATGAVGTVLTSGAAQTTLTGIEATGSVGTAAVSLPKQVSVTGVEASGAVGTANATGLANVRPIGVQASGAVGTPSFSLSGKFPVTGVSATGSVGTVVISIPKQVSVTGLSAANDVGTVVVESKGQVSLTGVAASGAIGDTREKSAANVTPTGVGAQGAVGTVTTQSAYYLTGVSATGQIGTTSVVAGCKVFVVGVQAVAVVTTPLVWSVINDNQTPNWVPVADSQTGNWAQVNDNQTPNWTPVNDSQTDGWTQINDGNTVIWTQIPT